jgi:peptidoglycan/LPS O-acetylase OafA/YrhL
MSIGFAGVDVFFVISGYLNRDKILAGLRNNSLNGDLRTIHIH